MSQRAQRLFAFVELDRFCDTSSAQVAALILLDFAENALLEINDSAFVMVDVQGRLALAMHEKERLFNNLQRLIKGMHILGIPVVWMEQIPAKMGPTIPELAALLEGVQPVTKSSFSCWGSDGFRSALSQMNRHQLLLAGIETHVCVYQTTADLVGNGYHVEVVADAVSSRTEQNRLIGLGRIQSAGAQLTSVETALFELLRSADHTAFRDILKIIK